MPKDCCSNLLTFLLEKTCFVAHFSIVIHFCCILFDVFIFVEEWILIIFQKTYTSCKSNFGLYLYGDFIINICIRLQHVRQLQGYFQKRNRNLIKRPAMRANHTLFRIRLHTSFPILCRAISCGCIEQTCPLQRHR